MYKKDNYVTVLSRSKIAIIHPTDAQGMANNVDPSKLIEQSNLGLHRLFRSMCPKT